MSLFESLKSQYRLNEWRVVATALISILFAAQYGIEYFFPIFMFSYMFLSILESHTDNKGIKKYSINNLCLAISIFIILSYLLGFFTLEICGSLRFPYKFSNKEPLFLIIEDKFLGKDCWGIVYTTYVVISFLFYLVSFKRIDDDSSFIKEAFALVRIKKTNIRFPWAILISIVILAIILGNDLRKPYPYLLDNIHFFLDLLAIQALIFLISASIKTTGLRLCRNTA